MKIECVAITNAGLVRESNEDGIYCDGWLRNRSMDRAATFSFERDEKCLRLFAVADGLGGHASGEVASQFALSRLASLLLDATKASELSVREALQETHRALCTFSKAEPSLRNMGSTVAGIAVDESGSLHLFHVGDSRIYRRQERFLEQMTVDDRHESGGYGEVDLRSGGTSLLQCLGGVSTPTKIEPHVTSFEMKGTSETFLLCTDGISDLLSQDELEAALSDSMEQTVDTLLSLVIAAGAKDNASIILLRLTLSSNSGDAAIEPFVVGGSL